MVQTNQENCVSRIPSLVPIPNRDIFVQAWYQAGASMVDFTDPKPKSFEGPIALQLHAGGRGNMKFRDIMVRDLTNHP